MCGGGGVVVWVVVCVGVGVGEEGGGGKFGTMRVGAYSTSRCPHGMSTVKISVARGHHCLSHPGSAAPLSSNRPRASPPAKEATSHRHADSTSVSGKSLSDYDSWMAEYGRSISPTTLPRLPPPRHNTRHPHPDSSNLITPSFMPFCPPPPPSQLLSRPWRSASGQNGTQRPVSAQSLIL